MLKDSSIPAISLVPTQEWQRGPILIGASLIVVSFSVSVIIFFIILNNTAFHSDNYNEGWNIYHAFRVAHGEPLYDSNLFRIVNYPYISFYLTGWLGFLSGHPLLFARSVSWLGFIATVLGCLASVRAVGGNWVAQAFSAVLFTGICGMIVGDYIGVADPQFLAQGLSAMGLVVYLTSRSLAVRLIASPVCLIVALFIKHQEIAIPAAILADLAVNHRKELPLWLGVMTVLAFGLTALGFLAGDMFLVRLLDGRRYSVYQSIGVTWRILELIQLPLAAGAVWLIAACPRPYRSLFCTFGIVSFLCVAGFAGGEGVSRNVALDFILWTSMAAGLGVGAARTVHPRGIFVCAALVIAVCFEIELKAFLQFGTERQVWMHVKDSERDFRESIAFMSDRPGDAICEDMLLCYFAGKPLLVDPFNATSLVARGKLADEALANLLTQGRVQTIQLAAVLPNDDRRRDIPQGARFTPSFLRMIAETCRLDHVNSTGAFYVLNR